jgi:hypothetical protein
MTDWDEKGLLGRGKLAGRGKIGNIEGVPIFIPIFNFGKTGKKCEKNGNIVCVPIFLVK